MIFSALANSAEYEAFLDEQSELKNESKRGLNFSDLSHGSRTPRKKQKVITAEYKKFVHDLVRKHKEKPEAYIQNMSTPFSYAFPQYSDILELYDNQ